MKAIFLDGRCLLFAKVEDREQAFTSIRKWTGKTEKETSIVLFTTDADFFSLFQNSISNKIEKNCFLILCSHPKKVWNSFISNFPVIETGGALVCTLIPDKKYLYIFRRGFWDLPKGKQEKGEDIVCTTFREVKEETGLSDLHLLGPLPDTFHFMFCNDKWIVKKCNWFEMCYIAKKQSSLASNIPANLVNPANAALPVLTPQTEEDIEKACWLSKDEVLNLKPMYPSITFLTDFFFDKTQES